MKDIINIVSVSISILVCVFLIFNQNESNATGYIALIIIFLGLIYINIKWYNKINQGESAGDSSKLNSITLIIPILFV